jgi:ferritin-like metal-binding protein YciE
MEGVLPNSNHQEIIINKANSELKTAFENKINNSTKHVQNYSQIFNKNDDFYLFKFGLIGINKSCFSNDLKYQEIFNFGPMSSFYNIEEFSISKFGILSRILSSEHKTEQKLTNSESPQKRILSVNNDDLLSNIFSKNQINKFKKTQKEIYSLSDLHTIASISLSNLYSIQTQNKSIFLSLVILTGIGILFIAMAEYDYRITKINICSKFCYLIILGLTMLGVIINSILILISQIVLSQTLNKIKQESCVDLDLISLIESDLVLKDLLIPMSIGLGLMVFVAILGISLSCHFWGTRWRYRLWKPKGGRFM